MILQNYRRIVLHQEKLKDKIMKDNDMFRQFKNNNDELEKNIKQMNKNTLSDNLKNVEDIHLSPPCYTFNLHDYQNVKKKLEMVRYLRLLTDFREKIVNILSS